MWIRSAFWLGQPRAGEDARFRTAIDTDIVPTLRTLPGVTGAKALWPQRREDGPPPIHCQVLVEYADRAGVERMLASPERQAMRVRVKEIAARFEGTVSHIDYEVGPG